MGANLCGVLKGGEQGIRSLILLFRNYQKARLDPSPPVTGASEKGAWVRLSHPPVKGKVIRGFEGHDVGDRVRVELIGTDVEQGFIDFARAGRGQGYRKPLRREGSAVSGCFGTCAAILPTQP